MEYGYPGVDDRLVDLYRRIPPHFKDGARFARAVLQRHAPDVAAVPWVKTGKPLSHDKSWGDRLLDATPLKSMASLVLLRASGRRIDISHLADLNRHFRCNAAFRNAHTRILEDKRTYSRGLIDAEGVRQLIADIDSGWPLIALVQSLVTVELFYRQYCDD